MKGAFDFQPTRQDGSSAAPAATGSARVPAQRPADMTSLREVLTQLAFDGRRVLSVFLLGLLLTALAVWWAPRQYVAEASLLLRLGREYVYTPEVGDASGSPAAYDREQLQVAEARILTSRDLQDIVLKRLGIGTVYPALVVGQTDRDKQQAAALKRFDASVGAELLKGSNLLQVSFKHDDPEMSARVLTELIDAYMVRRSQVFARSSADSVEADFKLRKNQLEAADTALARFKQVHGIRAFSEELSLLLAQRNVLEQRVTDNSLALAQTSGRSAALRSGLSGMSADVTLSSETQRSDAVDHARKLLLDLRLKERDLAAKFSDSHLAVQDVRADIERATAVLKEYESAPQRTVRSGRHPARDVTETDLLRAQADERQARAGAGTISAQRASIDRRLSELSANETALRELERDRRLAEANYESAAKRLRDELALEDLDRKQRSNVTVVQPPRVPLEAKSMRPVVAVVGVLLSVLAALLTAFLSALLRNTFISPEALERGLGVPVLATVPERHTR